MGEPRLHAVAQPGEEDQKEAHAHQQHRLRQRLADGALHQHQSKRRFNHRAGQQGRQQRVRQESHEGVQQDKAIVLQENEKRQRNAGMVDNQFARPCLAGVPRAEVYERHGEQRQAHGAGDARPVRTVALAAKDGVGHRPRGEQQEADGDQQQRQLVQRRSVAVKLPEMHSHGDHAESIATGHQRRPVRPDGNVQQHRGQQAQDRKTDGHRQVQPDRRQVGPHQHHQRADVPYQRESGGQSGKETAFQSRPAATAEQQEQKNGEDQRAPGVAEDVDQQWLVKRRHEVRLRQEPARWQGRVCQWREFRTGLRRRTR